MQRPEIPDHELLQTIGRGAYGEVWLARNVMGSFRAVKVIWRRQFESDRPFDREFAGIERYEPVSRSSGGLVHVLHVGRNDAEGYFYYVMELADAASGESEPQFQAANAGSNQQSALHDQTERPPLTSTATGHQQIGDGYRPRTLRSDLQRLKRLPTPACLRLALDVVSGLSQLHRHGLVHRDVKPANIIYVSGRAKLADIGLVTGEGEGRTFVGTEGYIPPEGPGMPAADLYALGIVLYQASTGLSPERFPDVPPEWFAEPDGDEALELHEVILKACEGQKERRYSNSEQMQADLALLQSGRSVRRVRALERRYLRLKTIGIVGTTLLACSLAAAFLANYRARLAAQSRSREEALRIQAQASLKRAEAAEREARRQLYTALLEQASASVRSGELGQRVRALDAIGRAAAIDTTPELRGAAIAAMSLPDLKPERQWAKKPSMSFVRFDPAFERFALGHYGGPVEIRATSDQHLLATLEASSSRPSFLAWWSTDGHWLAIKRDYGNERQDADVEVWNVDSLRRVLLLPRVEFGAAAFHPRQATLLAGAQHGQIAVWDLASATELRRMDLGAVPTILAFSPDGERFAAAAETPTNRVAVYDASTGAMLMSHPLGDYVAEVTWHPNGRWLATADYQGSVHLIDAQNGEAHLLGRQKAQAVLATFSPGGEYLLSGGWDKELICWDTRKLERAFTIGLDSFRAQFRADGRECAIITETEVQLHSFERPSACRDLEDDLGPRLHYAAFSKNSRWLAVSAAQRLGVFDLTTGSSAAREQGAEARVFFSDDNELLASRDDGVFRWRIAPKTNRAGQLLLQELPVHKPAGFTSACLASNQIVCTTTNGSQVASSDPTEAAASTCVPSVAGISGASPDGRWLAIFPPYASWVQIYQLPSVKAVTRLQAEARVARVEFSPGGDEVAVSCDTHVGIWSTVTWKQLRNLSNASRLFYMPDARTYWLVKDYRTAGLYDARSLQLLWPLPVGTLPLAVSSDGRYLAASANARHLQVWDLQGIAAVLKQTGLDLPE